MMVLKDLDYRAMRDIYLSPNRPAAPYWSGDSNALLRALENAVKIVKMVSQLHNLSIVHGALRPATISLDIFSEVHLHDFSAAFRVGDSDSEIIERSRERGLTEDSLPYFAPESSGKNADYRSDYYGMGALFYEIFTGRTPFWDIVDPSELLHAHIARRPPLATTIDSSIPPFLAQVLAKLLEKSPDDRYQTSQGLISDLETISDLVRKTSRLENNLSAENSSGEETNTTTNGRNNKKVDFVVGSIDNSAHFRLPPNSMMFGRENQVDLLLQSFTRVQRNQKAEVIIISGPAGIGKTSLVETLRKPVVTSQAFYTSVKFG